MGQNLDVAICHRNYNDFLFFLQKRWNIISELDNDEIIDTFSMLHEFSFDKSLNEKYIYLLN